MIVWINGTFGVGKTTTSQLLADGNDDMRIFDPEWVGYMLSANLKDLGADDFQDLPPWRRLVPLALHEVHALTGSDLVAPQTVLVEDYWTELLEGMTVLGHEVFHVVLDCDESVLRQRIDADSLETDARQWRLDHLARYHAASGWMHDAADLVIDTTELSASRVAQQLNVAVTT